ncbi:hypothetical protein V6N13_132880 [Hibiscus sabdariffa]|uniref:Uncharacterized protein n=1 Tax=Hibiscus sabdariffa TaxID=183260 RepID=A0ABR2PWM1_9ROSI
MRKEIHWQEDQQQASGDGTGHEFNLGPQQAESTDGNDEKGTSSARNIAIGDQQQASGDGTKVTVVCIADESLSSMLPSVLSACRGRK